MRIIVWFTIWLGRPIELPVPHHAKFLCLVEHTTGIGVVYFEVEKDADSPTRTFRLFEPYEPISSEWRYCGTAVIDGLARHLYELAL